MKFSRLRNITAAIVSAAAIALSSVPASAIDLAGISYEKESYVPARVKTQKNKTYTMYIDDTKNKDKLKLTFFNGADDIPYIGLNEGFGMMKKLFRLNETKFSYKIKTSEKKKTVTVTLGNGSSAVFDFAAGEIYFPDRDAFITEEGEKLGILDVVSDRRYIRREKTLYLRPGEPLTISLAAYGIDMFFTGGEGYIPLQTLSDVFMPCDALQYCIVFNGKFVIASKRELKDEKLLKKHRAALVRDRSETLARFNYNELCLALDLNYGMKEEHNITSFDDIFHTLGYYEGLSSTDSVLSERYLLNFIGMYLNETHSMFLRYSYRTSDDEAERNKTLPAADYGECNEKHWDIMDVFDAAAEKAYPDGIPAFETVGNTVYVTFRDFSLTDNDELYYKDISAVDDNDTLKIISAAHERIMNDSSIENVVLDLSLNVGGESDVMLFVMYWLIGNAAFNMRDPLTGAQASYSYKIDVNFDGNFDEKDMLKGKNIYCIISPYSFSSANILPAMLSCYPDKLTILGQRSGGGTCAVTCLSTAYGAHYAVSSNYMLCTVHNGVFRSTEDGVTPDFKITSINKFYDREKLTEYINGLY